MNRVGGAFFGYTRLQEPYLRFYMRRRYIHPRAGLTLSGPYDADKNRDSVIHVGLIGESSTLPQARKLIEYLRGGHDRYRGFSSIFKAKSLEFNEDLVKEVGETSSRDRDSVFLDIRNAYLELAEKLPDMSTVIVALDDNTIDENYRNIKALRFEYSKKTIRLQLIKRSTLERVLRDPGTHALDYTLLDMATAIYAKAGGTPWVLDQQLIPAGIFIGIAFTRPKVRKIGQTKELLYYGILTVYNKFGTYLDISVSEIRVEMSGGTKGLYIPRKEMTNLLRQIISSYRPPVAIIHKSAKFHSDEKDAAKDVLGGEGIDYALLHLETSNPYRGYGGECGETAVRGDLVLDREIHGRAILFTTGCTQSERGVKERGRPGTPRPIELEVEENTTPYRIVEFARQVLALTKLDWNTTDLEVRMPITIKYARRASAFARRLVSGIPSVKDVRDLI